MIYVALALIGVISGLISGIVGTGSSIILLPILAYIFGAKLAVPIMAIASIMGNISRVVMWRKELNIRAFLLFSSLGIPATVLGANTLWVMSPFLSNLCIGLFFLCLIPIRHYAKHRNFTLNAWQMVVAGGVLGYITGIVFSTGPLLLPIFNGFGLIKGGLLATEAAASFAIYLTKSLTFGALGVLQQNILIAGIAVGISLIIGNYIGKTFVLRMSDRTFNLMLDAMLLIAGSSMLFSIFLH
ncbi:MULTISPECIES: sulfite exporter TauE/SafE family protein [Acinetobacter]|uniref:sulfite exporter TauE/SafE family protein n=1 Tax=Acinetobacter TaxID=469 RepID=UPI000806CD9F|nr:sulfite exporter TauE/SafE family protein [Acinetobacter gyllenbergii]OBY73134.1 membrane protein [Acinetobacter gyllenbergii]